MKKPRIELICIGSELLSGRVNTHAAYIGKKLESIAFEIAREHTVGDDPRLMKEVFSECWKRADVVINSGGLGPTFDDITRDVWAEVLKRPLQYKEKIVQGIRRKFQKRHIVMPEKNSRQGFVLKGATVIDNKNGTAPGQLYKEGKKILILLPGPARELVPMLKKDVLPALERNFLKNYSIQKSFHLVGVPESVVDQAIRPLVVKYSNVFGQLVTYGILASNSIITVKYRIEGKNKSTVKNAAVFLKGKFRKKLKEHIFGEDNTTLSMAVGQSLVKLKKTLAVAESCTGGLISKMLTDQPGASEFFVEGITTYSNKSKINRLGVSKKSLKNFGAVSRRVAQEMAVGLKKMAHVDYSLSITGIAGPGGGTRKKPIGLVFVGVAGPHGVRVKEFNLKGDRDWIRQRAAIMALDMLRRYVSR